MHLRILSVRIMLVLQEPILLLAQQNVLFVLLVAILLRPLLSAANAKFLNISVRLIVATSTVSIIYFYFILFYFLFYFGIFPCFPIFSSDVCTDGQVFVESRCFRVPDGEIALRTIK